MKCQIRTCTKENMYFTLLSKQSRPRPSRLTDPDPARLRPVEVKTPSRTRRARLSQLPDLSTHSQRFPLKTNHTGNPPAAPPTAPAAPPSQTSNPHCEQTHSTRGAPLRASGAELPRSRSRRADVKTAAIRRGVFSNLAASTMCRTQRV